MPVEETAHRLVGGRYALLEPLGRGGMGIVWRARDELLRRHVAVKHVALPPGLEGPERTAVRERVRREAQAAARLSHPASVTVFDVLEDDGSVYIVMELVEAATLAEVVEGQGPLAPGQAARLGLELAGALEAAHRQGIVHRDVKPGNVMMLPTGAVKLADFGIASVQDHPSLTSTGQVLGSPSYMAPEQALGRPTGPEVDWWGVGATLYYALEGRPPFERPGALATLTAVVNEDPAPAERAGPLASVLGRLLAKEPGLRPAAAELRTLLRPLATQPGDAPAPPPRRAAHVPPAGPDRPSRGPVVAALLVVVALMAGLILWTSARDDGTPGQAAPSAADEPGGAATTAARAGEPGEPGRDGEAPTPTTEASPATTAEGTPADWVAYTDPRVGYRVAHPPGWEVRALDDTRTDITDPATGSYLRVDWTDTPGPSPEGAWEALSKDFGSRHEAYEEIRIDPTTYKGFDAAVWEYAYTAGGSRLHAVNLGMVTGEFGFALNFQTPQDRWESSQSQFEAFKASFQVPG